MAASLLFSLFGVEWVMADSVKGAPLKLARELCGEEKKKA